MRAVTGDRLPAFRDAALLLDLDGTLIDLAPTPDSVVVPPGLTGVLRTLKHALGGYWSRRMTDEHRLVYRVEGPTIKVAQARYHY